MNHSAVDQTELLKVLLEGLLGTDDPVFLNEVIHGMYNGHLWLLQLKLVVLGLVQLWLLRVLLL